MARRNYDGFVTAATLLAAIVSFTAHAAAPPPARPLGLPGTASTGEIELPPFANLPEAKPAAYHAPPNAAGRVSAGTGGLAPPPPARTNGSATLAILGDLAPANPNLAISEKYLKSAIDQLNLLRPDLVLTVGDLVPGMARDAPRYLAETQAVRGQLEMLQMPWYPCAGETDILSGTRQAGDRRFEALYQKYQGPLYYSVDTSDMHAIILDSEDKTANGAASPGISDAQFAWLKTDLNRVFDQRVAGKRAQWVVVVVHRPMWREENSNWPRVHQLLTEFNRRPIVSVEGAGDGDAHGSRVVAVIAGAQRAYAMSPVRDGIRYYTLGPTAALPRENEDAVTAVSGLMLLKLEADDGKHTSGGVHPALLRLGGAVTGGEALVPDDFILEHERGVLDGIAALPNDAIGIDGLIDMRSGTADTTSLRVRLRNPLPEAIDIAMRSASVRFLGGAGDARRELANTYVEGFDLPWELSSRHMLRHLNPGVPDSWEMDLTRPEGYEQTGAAAGAGGAGMNDAPPQVEFLVHHQDQQGVGREIVLKRRVPVAALTRVPVTSALPAALWKNAPSGGAFAWELHGDEPRKLNPTWQMACNGDSFFMQVRVDDSVHSYWPRMTLDPSLGGIASDAVSFAWATDEKAAAQSVRRIWVLPFGPKEVELWTNMGCGNKQTELLRLNPESGIRAQTTTTAAGYEVTITLPRALIFGAAPPPRPPAASLPAPRPAATAPPATTSAPATATTTATTETATTTTAPTTTQAAATATAPAPPPPQVVGSAIVNISVHDNDQSARTWVRSASKEELGPGGWGKVELIIPADIPPR